MLQNVSQYPACGGDKPKTVSIWFSTTAKQQCIFLNKLCVSASQNYSCQLCMFSACKYFSFLVSLTTWFIAPNLILYSTFLEWKEHLLLWSVPVKSFLSKQSSANGITLCQQWPHRFCCHSFTTSSYWKDHHHIDTPVFLQRAILNVHHGALSI